MTRRFVNIHSFRSTTSCPNLLRCPIPIPVMLALCSLRSESCDMLRKIGVTMSETTLLPRMSEAHDYSLSGSLGMKPNRNVAAIGAWRNRFEVVIPDLMV